MTRWRPAQRTLTGTVVAVTSAALLASGCTAPAGNWRDPASPSRSVAAEPPPQDLSAGRSAPVADPVYPEYGNPAIDVLHYGLDLAWSPQDRELRGTARVTVRAVSDVSEVALDFSDAYAIDRVTVAGKPARHTMRDDDIVVSHTLRRDQEAVLVVGYRGEPEPAAAPTTRDDFDTVGATVEKDGSLWSMQEPYGAATWYPSNDHPSDEALYDVAITVPEGWAGVSSGRFVGDAPTPDGRRFAWRSEDPVATYVVALAVDRYRKHQTTGPRDIQATYWMTARQEEVWLPVLRKTPQLVEWLEERFGPYPFEAAGSVVVASGSAMETQGMVTMGAQLADRGRNPRQSRIAIESVLVHELAHQYFGNTVTPRDWRGVWLNEGFATYIEMLYGVEQGWSTEAEEIATWRQHDGDLRKDAGPPGNYQPDKFAVSNVYICPALMLHEIRKRVGDTAFFAMARDWPQKHRNQTVDRAAFISYVNTHTGTDLTALINTWLDSPTTPVP